MIELRSAAWYGDAPLELEFPEGWAVTVHGPPALPALGAEQIAAALAAPTGSLPLAELARGRRAAVIVIDDLTRPTPTAELVAPVVRALEAGGIGRDAIRIVIAAGTHKTATPDEVARKVGAGSEGIEVLAHDMRKSPLRDLGRSPRGVPIRVNAAVAAADLKVGIGGIYPHPSAGFSGGSKIVAPGVCGLETASLLHENIARGRRGEPAGGAFRVEVDAIASRIGLDFVVDAVLNQDRAIGALFCGDKVAAYRAGAEFARAAFTVAAAADADLVIADAYPFDASLHFALDRAFWPLELARRDTLRVGIAACPAGLGGHALDLPPGRRLLHRVRRLRPGELARLAQRGRNLRALLRRRTLGFLLFSPGASAAAVRAAHPRITAFTAWQALLAAAQRQQPAVRRVALYRCAPLLVPED